MLSTKSKNCKIVNGRRTTNDDKRRQVEIGDLETIHYHYLLIVAVCVDNVSCFHFFSSIKEKEALDIYNARLILNKYTEIISHNLSMRTAKYTTNTIRIFLVFVLSLYNKFPSYFTNIGG